MSRIKPLEFAELNVELKNIMLAGKQMMGFTPNDGLTMAHKPGLLKAMLGLVQAVYQEGGIALELKKLVALMTSSVSGCQYCKAHTSFGALNTGVSVEKLHALWEYEDSALFDAAEKSALTLARDAAIVPNVVTDAHFENLGKYFTDEQIVELVGVISLFGFLNRWNSTLATDLESTPLAALHDKGLQF